MWDFAKAKTQDFSKGSAAQVAHFFEVLGLHLWNALSTWESFPPKVRGLKQNAYIANKQLIVMVFSWTCGVYVGRQVLPGSEVVKVQKGPLGDLFSSMTFFVVAEAGGNI